MRSRLSFAAVVLSCVAAAAQGATLRVQDTLVREIPVAMFGSFWLDNPLGSIDVIGVDSDKATVTAIRSVYASEKRALDEGREQCNVSFEGDDRVRLVRTVVGTAAARFARCEVAYTVQLPRGADLKIGAKSGYVRVRNMNGNVTVKSINSNVTIIGVNGPSAVDIANGHVIYDYTRTPTGNMQATVVNGHVDVYAPPDANFAWTADTLAGDIVTTFPVRGTMTENTFQGHINAPGGPLLRTQSVFGRVAMIAKGTNIPQARSVRQLATQAGIQAPQKNISMPGRKIQIPIVGGEFNFEGSIVDVTIGEIRGPARVETAAGEIALSVVYGECNVSTLGGPINLGEIMGNLTARTGGGGVLVRAARLGGDIRTGGGMIRVLYTGGPTNLESAGGDIVVSQVAGSIKANTPSGDITLTLDPNSRTERIAARTGKGNIVLNINSRFAADLDATILTSEGNENSFYSDFPALAIRKDRVAGRTRIRATGKINGGGERIELYSDGGDIRITTQAPTPTLVKPPNQ